MKVIVTGSEGLLGKEIVYYLRLSGYLVAEVDYKNNSLHDLTNENAVKKLFYKNNADALVNCFAYNPTLPSTTTDDFSLVEFRKYLEINLVALFSVCREFIKNNETGSIVNFSSLYGLVAPNNEIYSKGMKDIAYGVSKAGVISLTEQLAVSYPNFRVNCIAPGGVFNNQDESFVEKYSSKVPLKRMMNKKELPPLVEFLINSKKNSYITGATFTIDGGYSLW